MGAKIHDSARSVKEKKNKKINNKMINTCNILLNLWFFAVLVIFAASFKKWSFSWDHYPFGFLIIYIMIYPIYKEWYKYLNVTVLEGTVKICISILIIILLLILLLILMIETFPKFLDFIIKKNIIKNNSNVIIWFNNFFILCSTWVSTLGHIPRIKYIIDCILNFFYVYVNTDAKRKIFFSIFVLLPLSIQLFVLFYDNMIRQEIYWYPKIAFLLLIPLFTMMVFLFIEKATYKFLEDLDDQLYLDFAQTVSIEKKEFLIKQFGQPLNQYSQSILLLRKHLEGYVTQESFDAHAQIFIFYHYTNFSCRRTRRIIFNAFLPKKIILLLILQIILQIIITCIN